MGLLRSSPHVSGKCPGGLGPARLSKKFAYGVFRRENGLAACVSGPGKFRIENFARAKSQV